MERVLDVFYSGVDYRTVTNEWIQENECLSYFLGMFFYIYESVESLGIIRNKHFKKKL